MVQTRGEFSGIDELDAPGIDQQYLAAEARKWSRRATFLVATSASIGLWAVIITIASHLL